MLLTKAARGVGRSISRSAYVGGASHHRGLYGRKPARAGPRDHAKTGLPDGRHAGRHAVRQQQRAASPPERRWSDGSTNRPPKRREASTRSSTGLLVREGKQLRKGFEITPDYLKDTAVAAEEVNFADRGVQLSRVCRALKLWVSLEYFGVDAFRKAIDRALDLARLAQARIEASEELELLVPPALGVVCFRRRLGGAQDEDELAHFNAALVEGLAECGEGVVSSTRLR